MPTYEFRCPSGHQFERFYRKISDAASEVPCPECGAIAARQLSGGAGLLFKGSGFYLTDYGKNAHAKRDGKGPEKAPGEKGAGEKAGGEKAAGEGAPTGGAEAKSPAESGQARAEGSSAKPAPKKSGEG